MAKKSNKKTSNNKTGWVIVCILLAVLIFFTVSRMGQFGVLSNNIASFLLSTLYIIPILTLFFYGIYFVFFNDKDQVSDRLKHGLIILNIFVVLLSAYITNEVSSVDEFFKYVADNFMSAFSLDKVFPYTGGFIGNFLYSILLPFISRTGVLIALIVLFVIACILIVPAETYFEAFDNTKNQISEKSHEFAQRRQEDKIAKQKALEERRARQAEEMAKLAEEEELRRQEEERARIQFEEEERLRLEQEAEERALKEAREAERKKREAILSKSPTFINLSDDEINGRKRKSNDKKKVSETSKEDDIPLVKEVSSSKGTGRVLKASKKKGAYHLPKPYADYLESSSSTSSNINKTSAATKGDRLLEVLSSFGIQAELINTYIGPSVTKFEIKPSSSVKINRILNISDNIKMELAAKDIRIEAPMPGRSAVGIEIPNVEPIPVKMLDLVSKKNFTDKDSSLLFALGKDLMGEAVYCDLAKMPHLLIAGATGSGKSVCINAIITSFLLRTHPDDVKLVLVDPKKVEFTPYKDIPHLIWPIIDDAQMASNMLKKVVVIMEERYDAFASVGVRNISAFNEFVEEHNANLSEEESPMQKLPYMVVIIDELADLMAIAGKDVELSIQRITQLARASGIHLIVATQRPSTDVITGLIKSNIPSRISFAVASSIDSRTILDQTGAERLLGNGDMLYYPQGETAPIRLQGVFVTDREINKVTKYVKSQAEPEYEDSYYEFLTNMNGTTVMSGGASNADAMDSLYDEVVEFVKAQQKASTSLLQRRFGIGYNRAARLIDTLEDRGIIGPANGAKPREVYLKDDE